jgi:type VI secretion system protein ImpL
VNVIKQLLGLLKLYGVKVSPAVLATIAIGLPLLVGGALLLKKAIGKRRTQKLLSGNSITPPVDGRPQLTPNSLLRVHARFLQALPGEFRRAIVDFQPFVLLGPALSGKTTLAQAFTDSQRQRHQFLESALDDTNLQIHLGSSVVVHELSGALVRDSSAGARKALTRLWSDAFAQSRRAIVVVPVRLAELARIAPDAVATTAELIRGKVDLLSMVLEQAIEVRVVLTHMDELPGFDTFAAFAQKARFDLVLPIRTLASAADEKGGTADGFEAFTRYLPLALTQLPSSDYRAIVGFLKAGPEQLASLDHFVRVLLAHAPLARAPIASSVYLTSSRRAASGIGANPFHASDVSLSRRRRDPLFAHQLVAAAIPVVAAGYLGTGFVLERDLFHAAERAAQTYKPDTLSVDDERVRRAEVLRFITRSAPQGLTRLFPRFFSDADDALRDAMATRIRERVIVPRLARASVDEWAHLRSLYLLGAGFATSTNELGASILSNLRGWSTATGIDDGLLFDYVALARSPWRREPAATDVPTTVTFDSRARDERWSILMLGLAEALERGVMDSLEYTRLQADARQLRAETNELQGLIARFAEAPRILEMWKRGAPRVAERFSKTYEEFFREFAANDELSQRLRRRDAVLAKLLQVALPGPDQTPVSLRALTRKMQLVLGTPDDDQGTIRVDLAERYADFSPARWSQVVRASTLRRMALSFVSKGKKAEGNVFFAPDAALELASSGTAPAAGQRLDASADARYARRAYDQYVLPALVEFQALRTRFPAVCESEGREIDDFVYEEVQRYAEAYGAALQAFYARYRPSAESPEGILVMLRQMLSDRSAFGDFLTSVQERSQLTTLDGRYGRPMRDALDEFAGWSKIMAAADGDTSSGLDEYRAILAQVQAALGATEAPPPAGTEAEPNAVAQDLPSQLSPVGRVALSFIDGKSPESYQVLAEKWVRKMGLRDPLGKPFLTPFRDIERIGRQHIQAEVNQVWQGRMLISMAGVMRKFPFVQQAKADVTPSELEQVFHPSKGVFFELYRQFIAPITKTRRDGLTSVAGLKTPADMYEVIAGANRLASELWGPDGLPRPFPIRVATVPFDNSKNMESVLTLVYLSTGSTSMFNFNQKSYPKVLEIDWTRQGTSQVGVQLTDIGTRRNSYPNAIVAQASYWSFLRLLEQATVKKPYWSFSFSTGKDGADSVFARFTLDADPFERFHILKTPLPALSPLADATGAAQ